MKGHFLTSEEIERFRNYLREEEKSVFGKIKVSQKVPKMLAPEMA